MASRSSVLLQQSPTHAVVKDGFEFLILAILIPKILISILQNWGCDSLLLRRDPFPCVTFSPFINMICASINQYCILSMYYSHNDVHYAYKLHIKIHTSIHSANSSTKPVGESKELKRLIKIKHFFKKKWRAFAYSFIGNTLNFLQLLFQSKKNPVLILFLPCAIWTHDSLFSCGLLFPWVIKWPWGPVFLPQRMGDLPGYPQPK